MSSQGIGRRRGRALLLVVVAIAVTALVVVMVSGWPPNPVPPHAVETGRAPSAAPTARVECAAETGPLPSALASDPCPGAILAVDLAVAPVRLPIDRMVIEPGPFYCDVVWPGVGSMPPCYVPNVRPGQFMHAWVSFVHSSNVAAVMLGLDLPDDLDAPGATAPPWNATLVTVEIPPDGWVMP